MNKKIYVFLPILLLSIGMASAISPDSSLWKLELTWEKVTEFFGGESVKVNHMNERLQEIEDMIAKGKHNHALQAKAVFNANLVSLKTKENIETLSTKIQKYDEQLETTLQDEKQIVLSGSGGSMAVVSAESLGRVKKKGYGRVRLSGKGYVYMAGGTDYFVEESSNEKGKIYVSGEGRLILQDRGGDAEVEVLEKGFGIIHEIESGTTEPKVTVYKGKGRVNIRGSDIVVKIRGDDLYIDASGKGFLIAQGQFDITVGDEPEFSVDGYFSQVITPLSETNTE